MTCSSKNTSAKIDVLEETECIKNQKKIKKTGSEIAKNGLKEQDFIKDLINTNEDFRNNIFENLKIYLSNDTIIKPGTSKTDIISNGINIQVKKTKRGQFGQIDRHWIENLIDYIPELKVIENMLKNMCELPTIIDKNGMKKCDKKYKVKKINEENYSKNEIFSFIKTLNENKKKIIEYVFLGEDIKNAPNLYIVSVFCENREKIIVWKIKDIIDEILNYDVKIRESCTVIEIGKNFTFQRKGGDNGKETANQLQFKFTPTNISTEKAIIYKL